MCSLGSFSGMNWAKVSNLSDEQYLLKEKYYGDLFHKHTQGFIWEILTKETKVSDFQVWIFPAKCLYSC